ncbi:uncharacterized protein N7484_004331 [Penicillium longicatenatum]|uniref:uncharacterized protein n=1 Tax=Penicillium longicatenatum TaxID=1561947 RepID=UPI002548104E|nr:uncharacterized protein N7484_004331 [Penicillium longicatenatum]KAJ5650608.1 hypothetical protein N7484_004331 [Penicillium longicatenatum]
MWFLDDADTSSRNITASCREILAERPSWKSSDDSENMSLAEKMNRWQGLSDRTVERADYPASEWLHIDSADISTHEDDEDSSPEPNFPGVQAYKSLVKSDPSYGKLISDVFRECMVMSTLPDSLEEISSAISRILPASPRVSRKIPPERFKMMFKIDWDPVAFLQEQQYLEPPELAIGQAIVLTGSTTMVQTLTCSEYLQQTWPSSGVSILKLMQELVRPNHHPERSICILPDETQVKVGIEASDDGTKTSIIVLVNALPSWIIEIGEVLSWMGSALKTSPHSDRLVFCKPSVINARRGPSVGLILSDFTCTIQFTTHMAPGDSQLNGQCWHGLFKNPVVAEGFPIARRPSLKIGLEIPLAMMAILAGTSHAHTFGKSVFLKGFSTMLVPTESDGNFVLWHLISSKDGSRISYNDGVELGNGKTQLLDLKSSRHILGWCSTMKFLVGSRDARYSVETSGLPKASPTCLLANVTISQGHNVAGATGNISFGLKDFKSGGRRRNYIQKLKSIEKRFVLLWDEGHKRGWLVNGATALLHLVRASLEEDRNGVFSAATIFHPARMRYPEPYRPYSASWVLGDKSNARIPIYDDDNDPVLFHEYVTQFYEILEKAFDYQTAAVSANPERCTSRSRLEGWDFENLAAERDPIFAKEATLDCAGMAWIDLIRSVHAITLFGRGFGDMIQPIGTCSNWGQVPAGNSYLVICQEDLKEIVASWCGNLSASPPMLTDQIIWHIPENTAIKCRCISTKYMRHSDIAQVLLPSTMAYKVTGETLNCEDNKGGAFIFGLNSMNLWHWPEAGEPSRKPIVLIDGIRNDCETSETLESGMGGSCDSISSTREDSFNRRSVELRTEPSLTAFSMTSYSISDNFTVGIICALHIELMAVRILFDTSHDNVMVPPTDTNSYAFGSMGQHNVVATCLPDGEYGTNSAASVASNMGRTFSRLQFCLLVGIGGGVPSARNDIRLGDVVVSKPIGSGVGVLPYDMIKAHEYGPELNGCLQPPARILRSVSSLMQSDPRLSRAPLGPYLRQISDANPEYAYPDAFTDILYESGYTHPRGEETCEKCDTSRELLRPPRTSDRPKIHYGLIASGNKVMKDARERDNLAKEYGILCFEMEAAGIMNILPSFIIRGICDYADSHKNKKWQNYAAATAAAYTKLLLFHLRRDSESRSMSPALGSSRSMEGLDNGWASVGGESVEQEVGSGPVKRRRI